MSKIDRYAGNLRAFGSNAQGLERTLFGETTQADDLTSQVTSSFLRGWGIVGPSENPSMEDFNAAMYTMSQFIAYQHQMGIPEWDALQEYYSGSICVSNGEAYLSLVDSNIGSAPPSAKWTSVLTAKNALTNISGFLKSSNNLSDLASPQTALTNLGVPSSSLVPIGVPLPYPLATPPTGFLKCNGSSFGTATYPKLALMYPSGVLPDLRGEFIRGWDDGRGVDTGRSLLSSQIGSKLRACASTTTGSAGNGANIWHNVEFDQIETITLYSVATNATGLPFQVGIVRPRNLAFNYIVRSA